MNLDLAKELLQVVDYIEDRDIDINPNWFYHTNMHFDNENFQNMLLYGIKSPIYLNKTGFRNGLWYISISKNLKAYSNTEDSAYNYFVKRGVTFILDETLPIIKTKRPNFLNELIGRLFWNTKVPYRVGNYIDEYQVLKKIDPKYYVGLEYYIRHQIAERIENYNKITYSESPLDLFSTLKQLCLILDKLEIDLPLYDFSSLKEINKEKVKSLDYNNIK